MKAAGAGKQRQRRWAGQQRAHNNGCSFKDGSILFHPALICAGVMITAVRCWSVYLIMEDFTIGMLLAFQGSFRHFMAPVQELSGVGTTLVEMRTDGAKMEDVLNIKQTFGGFCRRARGKTPGDIRTFAHITLAIALFPIRF